MNNEYIVIEGDVARAFIFQLGGNVQNITIDTNLSVLENINKLCPLLIRDKAGTFIGARMGRPEKAKIDLETFRAAVYLSVVNRP